MPYTPFTNVASMDGPRITVSDYLKDPLRIPALILDMMQNEFIIDSVLRNAGNNESGAVRFEQSTPLFADHDPDIRAEFAEVRAVQTSVGPLNVAYSFERAMAITVSDAMRRRQIVDPVNRQLLQVKNSMVRAWNVALFTLFDQAIPAAQTIAIPAAEAWDGALSFLGVGTPGAPATPAVPASTVAVQNVNPFAVTVVITGGTMTNVSVAGATVGTGAGTYIVPSGSAITMTYTVAPTWAWSAAGFGGTWPTSYTPPTANTATITGNVIRAHLTDAIYVVENAVADIQSGTTPNYFGFEPDTLIIDHVAKLALFKSADFAKPYIGDAATENIMFTGLMPRKVMNMDVFVSRQCPTGSAYICQRNRVGFISDEVPQTASPLYRDEPRKCWRSDVQRAAAMGLDQPKAVVKLTGVTTLSAGALAAALGQEP